MKQSTDLNDTLFERARKVIPGGVNSPVRAFRAVGGTPRFVKRAEGAYFWDANGKKHIDYIGSWGPMILGHGHPAVLEAVQKAALDGFSFGAPTEREVELVEALIKLVPSMEMVRLVSSGTEAGMSAVRLARGATGRSKFIKFEGCYHGHADALLVKAGSGLATFGNPTSAGVPPEVVQHTLVLEYNNLEQLEEAFKLHGPELACLMIEPIAGNMNINQYRRTSEPTSTMYAARTPYRAPYAQGGELKYSGQLRPYASVTSPNTYRGANAVVHTPWDTNSAARAIFERIATRNETQEPAIANAMTSKKVRKNTELT